MGLAKRSFLPVVFLLSIFFSIGFVNILLFLTLSCSANQWTGLYMTTASVMKELILFNSFFQYLSFLNIFFNRSPRGKACHYPTLLKSWFINFNGKKIRISSNVFFALPLSRKTSSTTTNWNEKIIVSFAVIFIIYNTKLEMFN